MNLLLPALLRDKGPFFCLFARHHPERKRTAVPRKLPGTACSFWEEKKKKEGSTIGSNDAQIIFVTPPTITNPPLILASLSPPSFHSLRRQDVEEQDAHSRCLDKNSTPKATHLKRRREKSGAVEEEETGQNPHGSRIYIKLFPFPSPFHAFFFDAPLTIRQPLAQDAVTKSESEKKP